MRVLAGVVIAVVAASPTAFAQNGGAAEAEQLFRDAKSLMKQGKYAAACDEFETSQKLDPKVTTLANVADCREKNGDLATAWSAFLEVARQVRDDRKQTALEQTAKDRASKLEPRLSYLTVSVPDESRVDGLALTRNGEPFDEGLWNRAIPVDGGTITIAGKAPGHEAWETTVTIPGENGRTSVDVPKFKEAAKLVEPPAVVKTPPRVTVAPRVDAPSSFTGRRKLAVSLGAIGVLAVGGGVVLGLQAQGLRDDALTTCPANPCTRADDANALVDRARTRALFANLAYGAGAVAAITGAVLWFTGAPHASHLALAPSLGASFTGLAATGSF